MWRSGAPTTHPSRPLLKYWMPVEASRPLGSTTALRMLAGKLPASIENPPAFSSCSTSLRLSCLAGQGVCCAMYQLASWLDLRCDPAAKSAELDLSCGRTCISAAWTAGLWHTFVCCPLVHPSGMK